MSMCRVVITGMGTVIAGAESVDRAWDNIIKKQHNFSYSFFHPEINARFFSFLKEAENRYSLLPRSLIHVLPEHGKLALESCRQAFVQAFGDNTSPIDYYKAFDCGVLLGSGWGAFDITSKFSLQYHKTGLTHPKSNLITMPGSMTAACAIMYGLRGYQNTITAACATGSMAIGEAFELIRSGRAKCMVAGGAESLKSTLSIWSIDVLKALSKETDNSDRACCPFSRDRSGFVLAEGAAVVCLEEYESAVARGAKILAEIKGYASFSDGENMTRPAEDVSCRARAIKQALAQAAIAPSEVDYINAHGTSTPLNDLYETRALKKVFGNHAYRIPISSTKSYTGHLISAAGSFETIVCVKAINDELLPATINLKNPDPECDLNYLPENHLKCYNVNTTVNVNSGFGGQNAALVITRVIN